MKDVLDLDRYPIDRPEAPEFAQLVAACREELAANGMFNLHGFVRPPAIAQAAREIQPLSDREAFTHERLHNVYFEERVADLRADHGALARFYEHPGAMFSEAERIGFYGRAA